MRLATPHGVGPDTTEAMQMDRTLLERADSRCDPPSVLDIDRSVAVSGPLRLEGVQHLPESGRRLNLERPEH